ncbi:hypothetical protein HDU99_003146, partial [Rhizoclosmatium hyalinum]
MKSIIYLAFLVASTIASPVPQGSDEAIAVSSDYTSLNGDIHINQNQLDRQIESIRKKWNVPGVAVGVVHKGKLVYGKGFGVKDAKKGKGFTACAIAQLVDQKKLDWNTPVTTLYPGIQFSDTFANTSANLIDILSHRSGFPSVQTLEWVWSTSDTILSHIGEIPFPVDDPQDPKSLPVQLRQKFQYSNTMFALAGEIAAKASGLTWEKLVQTGILEPLGMKATLMDQVDVPSNADFSRGFYTDFDGSLKVYDLNQTHPVDSTKPAGSIVSNIEDLAKWAAFFNKRGVLPNGTTLVSSTQFNKILKPYISTYSKLVGKETFQSLGLGWNLESFRGKVNVGKSAGLPGYVSQIDLFPNDDLAIIVLSNGESQLPLALSRQLADTLLFPRVKSDWTKEYQDLLAADAQAQEEGNAFLISQRHLNTTTSLSFKDYEGTYQSPTFGTISLKYSDVKNNYYTFEWKGEQDQPAKSTGIIGHWEYDVFGIFELSIMRYKNFSVPFTPIFFGPGNSQFVIPLDGGVT